MNNSTVLLKKHVVEPDLLALDTDGAGGSYPPPEIRGNISSTHAIDVIADDSSKTSVSVATNSGVRQTPW